MMVAKVMHAVGSDFLRDEIVPKVVRGEVTIALGMTEPEAGSDVAAIQSRAREVDGGWVLAGQKMVTTNGHLADYVFKTGRAHVGTPVTNAHLVCRLLLDKKQHTNTTTHQ